MASGHYGAASGTAIKIAFWLLAFMIDSSLATSQAPARQQTARASSADIEKVVQARFRRLEETSTTRLGHVKVAKIADGLTLDVLIRPVSTERLELHAEKAFALIWEALSDKRVPKAFEQLRRIQVSISHPTRHIVVDCPRKVIEDGFGFYALSDLQRSCQMR